MRLEFPHALYHLTSRGNARQKVVRDDRDRHAWLAMLEQEIARFGWLCHAYCLTDNHYHLVVETPRPGAAAGVPALRLSLPRDRGVSGRARATVSRHLKQAKARHA